MALGMSFGVLAGAVAMAILSMFGHILWGGICVSIGMLLGMVIGMSIPKK
jgi:membrane protein DedA with SNARE-associated domain